MRGLETSSWPLEGRRADYEDYNQHHGLRILGWSSPELGGAGRFRDCALGSRQAHQQGDPSVDELAFPGV